METIWRRRTYYAEQVSVGYVEFTGHGLPRSIRSEYCNLGGRVEISNR
jgi:hypothetical protein